MNKQELIDKAVEDLGGKLPDGAGELLVVSTSCNSSWGEGQYQMYNGSEDELNSLMSGVLSLPWLAVCSGEEFTHRAKELGWINGYKWGVEYPTNGKKPNLPFGTIVEVEYENLTSGKKESSDDVLWYSIAYKPKAFRIVDERYKPKHLELNSKPHKDNWFAREQMPQVGVECEVWTTDFPEWKKCTVRYCGRIMCIYDVEDSIDTIGYYGFIKFRPIKSEREKFVDTCIASISEFNKASQVFGELYDAGFRTPEGK